jgi:hypothetical protein
MVRVLATVTALVSLYYLLPMDRGQDVPAVVVLLVAVVVLTVVIWFQVRSIVRSPVPGLRAIEGLAFSIPLLLLSFATIGFLMSESDETAFTEPLTRTDALYFAVTAFATVGFGDIAPVSQPARLVVVAQMLVNLVAVGVGLRVIVRAVQVGRDRRSAETGTSSPRPRGDSRPS